MNIKLHSLGTLIFCFLLCTSSFNVFGQDPYLQKSNRKIRQMASDITREYQPRLAMGADQALQFRQKVAEFLIHREWVENNRDLSPVARYSLLKRISSRETSEMADILEYYKWEEYMRLKHRIQPVALPESGRLDAIVAIDTTSQ